MSATIEHAGSSVSVDDLLDAVLPARGLVAMLTAYFDESERRDGTFAVAGWAYDKGQAKRCRKEWDRLFKKYGGCHMTDLANAQQQFKGISSDESKRLITEAIEIINARASYGVAVSCNVREMEQLLPKWIKGFEGAYPVCCHMAMQHLGGLIGDEEVAYFFEAGHRHEVQAQHFMSRALTHPSLKGAYKILSYTFAERQKLSQLQTADVLAWEWTKYVDETLTQKKRLMRRSLIALTTGGTMVADDYKTSRISYCHLTGAPLERFCAQVTALGLMEVSERQGMGQAN